MEVNPIIEKLNQLEQKIDEQILLKKEVLNFNDACKYLDISASHLYKLTSQKKSRISAHRVNACILTVPILICGYNKTVRAQPTKSKQQQQIILLKTGGNKYECISNFRGWIGTHPL